MNLFLWGALPYIAFTFLIVGTLVRFFYFERNWTTKSSEFLEKKQLRIANPLFHFGLLCVIGGHVVGVLIPKTWTAAIGINDHMYHQGALYMGAVAGIIFIVGFLLLMKRRFTVPAMKVNTSGLDKWLYLFLTLAILVVWLVHCLMHLVSLITAYLSVLGSVAYYPLCLIHP